MCADKTYDDGTGYQDYWCKRDWEDCNKHAGARPCVESVKTVQTSTPKPVVDPCAPVAIAYSKKFDASVEPSQNHDAPNGSQRMALALCGIAGMALTLMFACLALVRRHRTLEVRPMERRVFSRLSSESDDWYLEPTPIDALVPDTYVE